MRTIRTTATAALVVSVLLATLGCNGARDVMTVRAQDRADAALQASAYAPARAQSTATGPVLVSCEPHQRALVRQVALNGQLVNQVECVAAESTGYAYVDSYGRTVPVAPIARQPVAGEFDQARVVPAVYPAQQRVVTERVVYREAPARRVERRGRTWKKSATIIGGSTAAGAGIGGLIGGKKGALIGAALGGGASTVYEATKHR